jgi:hypothetical protein
VKYRSSCLAKGVELDAKGEVHSPPADLAPGKTLFLKLKSVKFTSS